MKHKSSYNMDQLVEFIKGNFQVEIKFAAPQHKGTYYYNLLVKSDSYMDCDYSLDLKVKVCFLF